MSIFSPLFKICWNTVTYQTYSRLMSWNRLRSTFSGNNGRCTWEHKHAGFLASAKQSWASNDVSASLSQHSSVHHPHHPEGGWRWCGGWRGWVDDAGDLPPTQTINYLTCCKDSRANSMILLINKATVLKNMTVFLCKHPESLSFN